MIIQSVSISLAISIQYNINDFLVLTSSSFRQELVPAMDSVEMPGVSSAVGQEDTEDLSIPRAAINKMIKGLKTLFLMSFVTSRFLHFAQLCLFFGITLSPSAASLPGFSVVPAVRL